MEKTEKFELYGCTICKIRYKNESDAEKCYNSHVQPKAIKGCAYKKSSTFESNYPEFIEIDFGHGESLKYKRMTNLQRERCR